MTYPGVIEFLYGLRWFGLKLGLENTFRLAALVGNPQDKLRFIHVAGTNGKGSTCAMLESIYRATGLRVGLFTSPHLVSFRERIQVNRQLISEADVVRLVGELRESVAAGFQPVVEPGILPGGTALGRSKPVEILHDRPGGRMPPSTSGKMPDATEAQDACPTFFEFVTVMALKYFAEHKCDLVVWETGLGGRLDATNIVTPLASVITNIAFDHEKWLGQTLTEIAREKAGIIKLGVPVTTATEAPEALAVIEETASRLNAPATKVGQASGPLWVGETIALPLLGDHQLVNAALAVATARVLQNTISVTEEAIRTGLKTVQWPGRLQVAKRGHQTLLLDGAHNPAGTETLRAALEKHFPGMRPAMILGCLADKDWPQMCHLLAPLADAIFLAPVQSMRTASPPEMAEVCRRENPSARIEACATLSEALRKAAAAPFLVVTGSLHFIGEAMELLHLSAETGSDERGLNEWQTASERQLVAP